MRDKPKICFVSFTAYPMLSGLAAESRGGAEAAQVLLARELKNREFGVSFVVSDYGQQELEVIDGITIFKTSVTYRPKYPSPWQRIRSYYFMVRSIRNFARGSKDITLLSLIS